MQVTDKIKFRIGVAQYMKIKAPEYNLNPEKMYILGLLHDIKNIREDGNKSSKDILKEINFPYADIVGQLDDRPAILMNEMTLELLLLIEARSVVSEEGSDAGDIIGLDEKLKRIREKYGKDSSKTKFFEDMVIYLKN